MPSAILLATLAALAVSGLRLASTTRFRRRHAKLFADAANLRNVTVALQLGVISGITTNRTIPPSRGTRWALASKYESLLRRRVQNLAESRIPSHEDWR